VEGWQGKFKNLITLRCARLGEGFGAGKSLKTAYNVLTWAEKPDDTWKVAKDVLELGKAGRL
jgi:hypothetical protein